MIFVMSRRRTAVLHLSLHRWAAGVSPVRGRKPQIDWDGELK